MSSFGSQIRKRIGELYKAGQDVPGILEAVAEGATIEAMRWLVKIHPQMTGPWPGRIPGADRWRNTGQRTV